MHTKNFLGRNQLMWGLLLTILVSLLGTRAASAQTPSHTVYLPLVFKGPVNNAPPAETGPYEQLLAKVAQTCPAVEVNQVCYVQGQLSLTGAPGFSQPGAVAALAAGQRLSLTSTDADLDQISVAWLRLRADSAAPDQALTILAFGNVQLSDVTLFEGVAPENEALTWPSLQFTSSPLAGSDKLGSSGLVVSNPSEEEVLSLTLNGAVISLGSTALVEAQPGGQMTVSMATGSSLTQVGDASSVAVQGSQTTVPLDQQGQASGTPQRQTLKDDLDWYLHKMLAPLTEPEWRKLGDLALGRLNRANDRCIAGQARYVYNVLYWARIIEGDPLLKTRIDPARLAQAYSRAENCLTFEVEFDSNVTTQAGPVSQASHVKTTSLYLGFLADGSYRIGISAPLNYVSYAYNAPESCPLSTQTTSGTLLAKDGALKIVGNKIRIETVIGVVQQPTDKVTLHCPAPAGDVVLDHAHWVPVFYHMHEDLWEAGPQDQFHFKRWKYTGGEHFGETIYERNKTESGFTFNTLTYLILVHKPQS